MNILVTQTDFPYVSFTGTHGTGIGITAARDIIKGCTYGVEFDLLADVDVSLNTSIGSHRNLGFYADVEFAIIVAVVEDLAEDNEICLRIAGDCIILAYAVGSRIHKDDLLEIKVHRDDFRITIVGR